MTTLREAAKAAYERQEQIRQATIRRRYANLQDLATARIVTILSVEPGPFAKNQSNSGIVTIVDGIHIWATFDNWEDEKDVLLLARVWTNEDGMQWMTFDSLADLGELLAEDAEKPDDFEKYKDATAISISEELDRR